MAYIPCTTCSRLHYKRPRDLHQKNQYCSRECYLKSPVINWSYCALCSQKFISKTAEQRYCSRSCSNRGRVGISYKIGQPNNKYLNRQRNYAKLVEIYGEHCKFCNIGPEWQDEPLVLQVDHIDGDSKNNSIDNLRILCPNCHSQTETFGAKNIGRKWSLA